MVTISWDRNRKQLLYELEGQAAVELLDGVVGTIDAQGVLQSPFTLSYENGRQLYRATIDLTVEPNEVIQLDIEGDRARTIRLVGSAMPRIEAF